MNEVLEVRAAGPLATLQDTGRLGAQAQGIGTAGAMDLFAARVANVLLGNAERAAVMEITAGGAVLHALADGLYAVTGADLDARLDDDIVPLCAPFAVRAGQTLRFGRAQRGWRACLALAGGFVAGEFLGSVSTDLRGGFGGFDGRALQRGDVLSVAVPGVGAIPRRGMSTALAHPCHRADAPLRLIEGPALALLDADDRARLLEEGLSVSREADRMGLRMDGLLASAAELPQQISAAVAFGAVQLPPDGKPIILGADRQTTGGYPLAGVVAAVDHWRIAQARPGDLLRFKRVTVPEAQRAWRAREQDLARLRIAAAAAWRAG